jgi:NitT/TauT family transport system substrate-binding protein
MRPLFHPPRRALRRWSILLAVFLSAPCFASTRSNFASSITSESMAAVWVAKEIGLFRKYGLDVQFILMPRSPLAVAALLAGEIDMAVMGPGHLLNAAIGGADVVGIANFFQKLDYRLNGRPELKRPADLKGKRIAISGPGSTSHIVTLLALEALGLEPAKAGISFVTIPGTEVNRRIALETANVDATTLRGSIGDLYGAKGYPILFNFKDTALTMPQTMMVTTRRTAAAKPELVEAYLKAILEGIAALLDPAQRQMVTRVVASNLRLTNPADAEEAYRSVVNSLERVPYPNLDGMKKLHSVLLTINPKLTAVRPETVVDQSFINRLETSGFIQTLGKKP